MNLTKQLALQFEHRPSLGGDDFLVAPANADAVAWLDRWPDWPTPALVLHGPPGSGKTHLSRVFMAHCGAIEFTMEELNDREPPDLLASAPAVVIDDFDNVLKGGIGEESVLHLYNTAKEMGRCLLLTARTPPRQWGVGLADLRSRLVAAMTTEIGTPDDMLITAVLMKLFADRQLNVDRDVPGYMLARMERSFDAARRMVSVIDEAALISRRNVTVRFVGDVLNRMANDGQDGGVPLAERPQGTATTNKEEY